jgi:hypothetical protein
MKVLDSLISPRKLCMSFRSFCFQGGIVYSNKVLLMSSTLPRDMAIQGLGHGLEATLTTHKEKVLVASHGLDGELWDPSKDIYLPQRYSPNDIEGKSFCRKTLKRCVGLHSGSSVVVGCICNGDSNTDGLREAVRVALHGGAQSLYCVGHLHGKQRACDELNCAGIKGRTEGISITVPCLSSVTCVKPSVFTETVECRVTLHLGSLVSIYQTGRQSNVC